MCHPGQLSAKIKELTRSDRPIIANELQVNYQVNLANIKKLFSPKTDMLKKQVLQHPRNVGCVEGPCCMVSCKVII